MGLLEQYIEATMIENQDRYDQARRTRDEVARLAAAEARAVREIIYRHLVILDVDHSVMDLILDKLAENREVAELPHQVLYPALPDTPLLIDFGKDRLSFPDTPSLPEIAGFTFFSFVDPALLREAKRHLSSRNQVFLQPQIDLDLQMWSLAGLNAWGDEVFDYCYQRDVQGLWAWTFQNTQLCSTGRCRYASDGQKTRPCEVCTTVSHRLAAFLGLILLYNAGYFQTVVVTEAREPRSYLVNPAGRTTPEQEVTREVTIRRIRKNVLVKELIQHVSVVNPRGSWLAKHRPEEIEVKKQVRRPYKTRTRSGKIIDVTPAQPKRIPMLKKNVAARTVITLYAEPPASAESNR
jgi:hypothetical protein